MPVQSDDASSRIARDAAGSMEGEQKQGGNSAKNVQAVGSSQYVKKAAAWAAGEKKSRREQLPPGEQLTCKEKHAQNRRHTPPMAMLGIPVDN